MALIGSTTRKYTTASTRTLTLSLVMPSWAGTRHGDDLHVDLLHPVADRAQDEVSPGPADLRQDPAEPEHDALFVLLHDLAMNGRRTSHADDDQHEDDHQALPAIGHHLSPFTGPAPYPTLVTTALRASSVACGRCRMWSPGGDSLAWSESEGHGLGRRAAARRHRQGRHRQDDGRRRTRAGPGLRAAGGSCSSRSRAARASPSSSTARRCRTRSARSRSGPGGGDVFALAVDPEEALLEYLEMFYKLRPGRHGAAAARRHRLRHHDRARHARRAAHRQGLRGGTPQGGRTAAQSTTRSCSTRRRPAGSPASSTSTPRSPGWPRSGPIRGQADASWAAHVAADRRAPRDAARGDAGAGDRRRRRRAARAGRAAGRRGRGQHGARAAAAGRRT